MYDSDEIYPRPVSDPEATGLPETADDGSNAYDEVLSVRAGEGEDLAPLPGDREDKPAGLEEYGTGGGDGLRGEALWRRLRREVPDETPDDLDVAGDARMDEEADPDALDQLGDDSMWLAENDRVPDDRDDETSVY